MTSSSSLSPSSRCFYSPDDSGSDFLLMAEVAVCLLATVANSSKSVKFACGAVVQPIYIMTSLQGGTGGYMHVTRIHLSARVSLLKPSGL